MDRSKADHAANKALTITRDGLMKVLSEAEIWRGAWGVIGNW